MGRRRDAGSGRVLRADALPIGSQPRVGDRGKTASMSSWTYWPDLSVHRGPSPSLGLALSAPEQPSHDVSCRRAADLLDARKSSPRRRGGRWRVSLKPRYRPSRLPPRCRGWRHPWRRFPPPARFDGPRPPFRSTVAPPCRVSSHHPCGHRLPSRPGCPSSSAYGLAPAGSTERWTQRLGRLTIGVRQARQQRQHHADRHTDEEHPILPPQGECKPELPRDQGVPITTRQEHASRCSTRQLAEGRK